MKIIRDGKEIVLTAEELRSAYYEQEHEFDIEDIIGELEGRVEGEDKQEAQYARELLADRNRLSDAADKKRDLIDNFDVDWNTATREAVNVAIAQMDKVE